MFLGLLSEAAIAGVLPPMTLPSTAAAPVNTTLQQDFADISPTSLFIRPRPVWSGPHYTT
jgi:hypothetical protein